MVKKWIKQQIYLYNVIQSVKKNTMSIKRKCDNKNVVKVEDLYYYEFSHFVS